MRITLKPVNGGTTSNQAVASKVSGQSFLDMLTKASSNAANNPSLMVVASNDSSSDTSDHGNEDQTSGQPIAASEKGADDAQEIFTAGGSIGNLAAVIGSKQNQDAAPAQAASTIGRSSSAHSQPKSKASQPAEEPVTDSIQQAGDQAAAQQLPASMPAIPLSEVSIGGSMQFEATSPKDSTELPASPAFQWSNANPTARTGSDGADTSQSAVPSSASPAVSQSENSIGRSMQFEATAPKDSVQLPALSPVLRSNANPTAQNGSDEADTGQRPVPSSAVPQSEVSVGRWMQSEAASPKVSADLPTFSPNLSSNANSAAQTGSDEADSSQSAVPSSASPAVSLSEVSVGRATRYGAALPKVSADLPTFSPVLLSNANSTAQTGSDSADASQSSVPPSASPATTDLSKAIVAGLIEPSTFAVGSTFAQSTILSNGGGTGTLSDRTSQFKSSGSTFTVNSSDTSSTKVSSARDSISADHSAQSGNPLPQHALGDSSVATPLAIKAPEATVTQTVPVSNHTASVSSGQPHAATSTTDVPIKAQDSADAAAEHLERAGTTAAAGFSTARLIQTLSESEMRVGMRSAEFGDISIRTSVSQQQLTAQISVDHSELGSAISAHLPSLESKLGSDFGLHASIEVNQLGASVTGGNGQSSHQDNKMTSQSASPDSSVLHANGDQVALPGEWLEVEDSRLDIRA